MARAKELFGAEHVNVQPLSGSPANLAVYMAAVKPGDKVLGLKLDHGGHLSHGHPVNFSGLTYSFVQYEVDEKTQRIDMDQVRAVALRERPKMIIAGFSAYSRDIDWAAFKCDRRRGRGRHLRRHRAHRRPHRGQGAGQPGADLRHRDHHDAQDAARPARRHHHVQGKFQKDIDRTVFPGIQGGPHDHINAAKAVCFHEALQPSFRDYARATIANAQALAGELMGRGYKILTDGTDNHLMVVDLRRQDITGKVAEATLDKVGISCSRSTIPFDTRKALDPSGIRLGAPALTTRGMGAAESIQIAGLIDEALRHHADEQKLAGVRAQVRALCRQFPLYGA